MVGGWWLRPILVFSLSLDQAEQQHNKQDHNNKINDNNNKLEHPVLLVIRKSNCMVNNMIYVPPKLMHYFNPNLSQLSF